MKSTRAWLILFVLILLNGCSVTVPNLKACTVSGTLSAGLNCAETLSENKTRMNFREALEFIQAQPERPDPNDANKMLPKKGAAIMFSADDFKKIKDFIEQACRKLGEGVCSKEVQAKVGVAMGRIENLNAN